MKAKISELLNAHGGLVSMAGGPGLPNKLGKFNYGVIKNLRKLEGDVIRPFQEARERLVKENLEKYPVEQMTPEIRQTCDRELSDQVTALLNEETEFDAHLMDAGILEICTAGEAAAIWMLVREEEDHGAA